MSSVVDASAVLAVILGEAGAEVVREAIVAGAAISAVNVAEVVTRLIDRGISESEAIENVLDLTVEIVPFDEDLAFQAGLLRPVTRTAGLSLGDRACLALARRLGLPALTADRSWATLALGPGIAVEVIR